MNAKTVSVIIPADKEAVFSFFASIDNLPRWATEFCRELKVVEGKHKVVTGTPDGPVELFFRIDADAHTGVIDYLSGPTEAEMEIFPARVVGLPNGDSAFIMTMIQDPAVPADLFEEQYASLKRELENARRTFESAEEARV